METLYTYKQTAKVQVLGKCLLIRSLSNLLLCICYVSSTLVDTRNQLSGIRIPPILPHAHLRASKRSDA